MPTADVRQEQWRDYLKYGALANMRPLYALMLELVDEYYDRHEITQVLALLHLMSDHLGQLAWQSALPNLHPRTVAAVIGPRRGSNQKQAAWIAARPSNHWARRTDCSVDGAWTTVLRSYSDYSPKPLVDALRSSGTRTSAAIVGCMAPGGLAAPGKSCPNPCCVQAQTDAALDAAGRPPMRRGPSASSRVRGFTSRCGTAQQPGRPLLHLAVRAGAGRAVARIHAHHHVPVANGRRMRARLAPGLAVRPDGQRAAVWTGGTGRQRRWPGRATDQVRRPAERPHSGDRCPGASGRPPV